MTERHVGFNKARLQREPEEKRFSDAWKHKNEVSHLLDYLVQDNPEKQGHPVECSDRDTKVAATVIQWLGSPVGQFFLEELGYRRCEEVKYKRFYVWRDEEGITSVAASSVEEARNRIMEVAKRERMVLRIRKLLKQLPTILNLGDVILL